MANHHIQVGICLAPDRIAEISPGYDFCEPAVGELQAQCSAEAFAPIAERMTHLVPHVRALNCFIPGDLKIVGPDVTWEPLEAYATTAIARAAQVGANTIVFGSGGARRIPDGYSRAKAWGQLVRFADMCGQCAAKHGLVIAIEPLNHTECNVVNSYLEGVALAKDVDRPRSVRVLADIYHFMMDGEPLDDIQQEPDWLTHVHLADTDRRFPGSGSYPLERLFAILDEVGYRGRVSIECSWGNDLADESARALSFLRGLLD